MEQKVVGFSNVSDGGRTRRINYVDARSGMLIKGINQGSSLHYFGRDREQFSSVFLSVEGNKVYFH